jgi:SAM-dependent methyltransferase
VAVRDIPLIRSLHRAFLRAMPAPVYGVARRLWRWVRPWLPMAPFQRSYPELPGPVHDEDHMLQGTTPRAVAHYRQVGLEACERIEQALAATGRDWASVASLLDYGSGHARVLRWISTRQPHIDATAADVNHQAVRFCSRTFGVRGMKVPADVDRLTLDASWDVIWVGSVFTHLSERDGSVLLQKLRSALRSEGLLLFTTHGELIPERLDEYGDRVRRAARDIEAAFLQDSVFFTPSDPFEGPVTFHSRASVQRMIAESGLRPIAHWPRGWDDHQDVWAVASADSHV